MTFRRALATCLRRYVGFSGRAPRSEFWWWVLFVVTGAIMLGRLDVALFGTVTTYASGVEAASYDPILSGTFGFAAALPTVSVAVRRLHDTDRAGWWVLLPAVLAVAFTAIGFVTLLFALGYGLDDDMLALVWVSGLAWLAATALLIVWWALPGTEGPNRFGGDPFGPGSGKATDEAFAVSSVPSVPKD